jgi:tetratricopeptide (TPR) repeat protein
VARALRYGARSALGALLAVGTAGGCVTHTTSSPFIIRQGHGPIEIEAPALRTISRDEVARAERAALAERAKQAPRRAISIEQQDPGLRQALWSLQRETSSAAHVAVAVEYHRVGVLDAAFDQFSQALVLDRRNVSAWDGRARVWRDWGMITPALTDAHRARYLAPQNAAVLNTLGTILERAGQCESARSVYRDALRLDDRAMWARQNLTRLEPLGPDCRPSAPTMSRRLSR